MFLFANESSYLFFTILIMVVSVIVIVIIFLLIRYNSRRFKEESSVILNESLSKTDIKRTVTKYLNKVGAYGACSLLYCDLDGFTNLNEMLGRKACDEILKEVALKILRALPYNATFSLYNNDEFLIFVKEQNDREALEALAKKICDVVNTDYRITVSEDINLTCSIGCVTYPTCGTTFGELLTNLELSTYVSKRDGGNKFTTYYSTLTELEKENFAMFSEVKQAIKNKEFVLYYQPIIDIEKNTIFGAEALMRWNHPSQGIISPQRFLPVLEQSGDIKWVGEWGLETIVKEYLTLSAKHVEFDLKISLNLSTKQLLNPNLSSQFIDIVKKYGVEPSHFMLEIGEYTAYDRLGKVKNNLLKLRDYGFLVAVDGFDLDESALFNIERAPIDVIKLDRTFLSDKTKDSIKEKFVALLVEFAKTHDHQLICEGIENQEMVEYIRKNGIKFGQGYYYSKPLAEEDFVQYIAGRKWRNVSKSAFEKEIEESIITTSKPKIDDTPATVVVEKDTPPVVQPLTPQAENTLDFLEGLEDDFDLFDDTK